MHTRSARLSRGPRLSPPTSRSKFRVALFKLQLQSAKKTIPRLSLENYSGSDRTYFLDVKLIPASQEHPRAPCNVQRASSLSTDKYEKTLQGVLWYPTRMRSLFIGLIRKLFLRNFVIGWLQL
jgi:hypothetical protein